MQRYINILFSIIIINYITIGVTYGWKYLGVVWN